MSIVPTHSIKPNVVTSTRWHSGSARARANKCCSIWMSAPMSGNPHSLQPMHLVASRCTLEQSYRSNTTTRLAAALNSQTGAVQALSGSRVGSKQLVELYQQVRQAYPQAERIWIVQDHWPVHFHPDVLVALEPQKSPFPFPRPDNWPLEPSPAAVKRSGTWHLPIQLVVLPTSAPFSIRSRSSGESSDKKSCISIDKRMIWLVCANGF